MDRFIAGSILWPPGCTRVHVYFVPDLSELKPLLDIYRAVLGEFDLLTPIPDKWLHATIKMIDGPFSQDISTEQKAELEFLLRQEFQQVPTFNLVAGGCPAGRTSALLDLTPDREFRDLVVRTERIIGNLFGNEANSHNGGRPHIALSYASRYVDSAEIAVKLRNATDLRVPLTVSEVRLVDVVQDVERNYYWWKDIARLPLGGSGHNAADRNGAESFAGRAT